MSARRAGLAALVLAVAGCGGDPTPDPGGATAGFELRTPAELPSPAGPGSAEPNLAVGRDGRVYLSWLEPASDSGTALRLSVLEQGRWSAPRTVGAGRDLLVNWADFPSLAVLPDGRLVAHYLERDPEGGSYAYGVRLVQSTDGGASWSAPVTPHRDDAPVEHGFVSLFPAAGDSVALVWLDGRKMDPRHGGIHETALRYTTVAPDGGLGEDRVVDERTCDCCQTEVARTTRGPVVVYRDRDSTELRDIYLTRLENGGWTVPTAVHRDGWEIEACPVNGPAASADGERVAVAWFTAARDTARVLVAFSDDAGVRFAAPARVDAGDPEGRVDVELLADGRALVSWVERGGEGGARVAARLVSRDGSMGEPVTVANSSAERASGFPRMARAGDAVVFAWTETGDRSRVRVARVGPGEAP